MKDKLINKIREKCIEANPDIVELKFGCRVLTKSIAYKEMIILYVSEAIIGSEKGYKEYLTTLGFEEPSGHSCIDQDSITKVLGRPIGLADVLLAIKAHKEPYKPKYVCTFCDKILTEKQVEPIPYENMTQHKSKSCHGYVDILNRFLSLDVNKIFEMWDLKHDKLESQ